MNAGVRRWTLGVAGVGVMMCWAACVVAETETKTKSADTTCAESDNEEVRAPKDYEGRILLFPDDSESYKEDTIVIERVFTFDKAHESLAEYWRRSSAQNNFHDAFTHRARNENAPKGERDKRLPLEPYGLKELPDDAVIVWRMSKPELAEFGLPGWEERALGMPNIHEYLKGWIDYQQYTVARLELKLMDCDNSSDLDRRAALESQLRQAKQAVIEFFQTPPAD